MVRLWPHILHPGAPPPITGYFLGTTGRLSRPTNSGLTVVGSRWHSRLTSIRFNSRWLMPVSILPPSLWKHYRTGHLYFAKTGHYCVAVTITTHDNDARLTRIQHPPIL